MCGGTRIRPPASCLARGLSPRVRGNHGLILHDTMIYGSIPACAGEPTSRRRMPHAESVYPRVCGGTISLAATCWNCRGLSPRVRGNPLSNPALEGRRRSIPACAGEPRSHASTRRHGRVYPRVCGGTGCGTTLRAAVDGLSPRVRGNQGDAPQVKPLHGSIPACAGEPCACA